ncbi:hypothetical protein H1235_15480 [Pseudoxanthomonas sp. NC8]|nr:hypothetical protein H1235_15480 [Pseudoxanthomonas sp. NC8]
MLEPLRAPATAMEAAPCTFSLRLAEACRLEQHALPLLAAITAVGPSDATRAMNSARQCTRRAADAAVTAGGGRWPA